MDGTQGVIVLSLMAAMLAFHSVNCKPFSFSFPQPTSTTGRSDFPAFSPVPFYNPYQFQFPNYNYEPWSQGGTRARSQSHAVANNKEIASEQFLSAVGSFLVSYILNRIQDEIRSDDSGVVSHATAQYRGPAHVNQDDDIDSDQTLEELLDQLIEKYGDQLPENPTKVQVRDLDLLVHVHVPVHRGQIAKYKYTYSCKVYCLARIKFQILTWILYDVYYGCSTSNYRKTMPKDSFFPPSSIGETGRLLVNV